MEAVHDGPAEHQQMRSQLSQLRTDREHRLLDGPDHMCRYSLLLLLAGCLVSDVTVEDYLDRDRDGAQTDELVTGTDCNDADPAVGPHADEVCGDGIDNDCDGNTDDVGVGARAFQVDRDGDGWTVGPTRTVCTAPGDDYRTPSELEDCDDTSDGVHPNAPERCDDEIDSDCSGDPDDGDTVTWYEDADGDGFGGEATRQSCRALPGWVASPGDCDDTEPRATPGGEDPAYDGIDGDCLGGDDFDADHDGIPVDPALIGNPPGYAPAGPVDCDDTRDDVRPGTYDPPYDGLDQDCGGEDDFDVDADGHRAADHGGDDCDDNNPAAHPGRLEVLYNDTDEDCDPSNDWDADGDGRDLGLDCDDNDSDNWISCSSCVDLDEDGAYVGCDAFTTRPWDCNDGSADFGPLGVERSGDGVDHDCDGEDLGTTYGSGVFVAPSGTDQPGCGLPDQPCRQPAFAEPLAFAAGKVLFVADGDYEVLETRVSVYGGFDELTWARTEGYARIASSTALASALRTIGGLVRIERVELVINGNSSDGVGLTAEGAALEVSDSVVDCSEASESCIGIRVATGDVKLERVDVAGFVARREAIGIEMRSTGMLDLWDSQIDVEPPCCGDGAATGIRLSSGHLTVTRSLIHVAGSGGSGGIAASHDASDQSLTLTDSSLFSRGIALSSSGFNGDMMISRSSLGSTESDGAFINLQGHLSIRNSQVESANIALTILQNSPWLSELTHVTLLSHGTGAVLDGVVQEPMTATNVAIVGGSQLRVQPMCDHCFLDLDCTGPSCLTAADLDASGGINNLEGNSELELVNGVWAPTDTSPLIDAGTQDQGSATTDLRGDPRQQGTAPDIGAVEANP